MKTEELMAAFESLLPEHRLLTDIQNTLSTTRRGDVYVIDEETLHVPCDVSLSLIRKTMRFEFNDGAPYVHYIVLWALDTMKCLHRTQM